MKEIKDETVLLDGNHPLAGMLLYLVLSLVSAVTCFSSGQDRTARRQPPARRHVTCRLRQKYMLAFLLAFFPL